jgi:hypothetical protein
MIKPDILQTDNAASDIVQHRVYLCVGERFGRHVASLAHALLDQRHRKLLVRDAVTSGAHVLCLAVGDVVVDAQQDVLLKDKGKNVSQLQ